MMLMESHTYRYPSPTSQRRCRALEVTASQISNDDFLDRPARPDSLPTYSSIRKPYFTT